MAQQRETITNTEENMRHSLKEVYHVLKTDTSMRDGSYKFYRNNKLVVEGYYAAGEKDGVWKVYDKKLLAIRHYDHGKKVGKWEFFSRTGIPEWSYTFEDKKIWLPKSASKVIDTTTYYYQNETGDWVRDKMDVNPVPLYGIEENLVFLVRNVVYPPAALERSDQGVVLIAIDVDENGDASNWRVAHSDAATLNEEAVRVMQQFYRVFIPAEKNGKKVKSIYFKALTLRLEDDK